MRRFLSFVAFLGAASWPVSTAFAQDEYPSGETQTETEVEVDVDVGGESQPPPTAPPPSEPVYVEPAPMTPDYEFEPEADEAHRFLVEIQPYGWLPLRYSGDAGGNPVGARLDGLFEGDQFSMGGGLRLEAWASRLGLIADGTFLQLEDGSDAAGQPDFRSRQFIGDFLAGFRLIQTGPLAGGPSLGFAITGGIRMIYDKETIGVGLNEVEQDDWIAKGSLGADIPLRFSESFGLRARGAVRYPDFDWSVTGLVEFDALPVGVDLGYRYENLDYEEGGLDTDVDVHSVYLGLGFQAIGRRDHGID